MALAARDYSLTGEEAKRAVANGLAGAKWYASAIPRKRMKELMERSDGPALRDTALWLGLTAAGRRPRHLHLGHLGRVPSSSSTASSTAPLGLPLARMRPRHGVQDALDERRGLPDRLLHGPAGADGLALEPQPAPHRHHHRRPRPEIIAYRPPDFVEMFLDLFNISGGFQELRSMVRHAFGRLSEEEKGFIPEMEHGKVFVTARI